MKKLLVAFVAVVAVSFASCGGNTSADATDTIDTTCCEVEEVAEDTVAVDTTAADTIAE